MTDDTDAWLTTNHIKEALAGHRDNDIKVEIKGTFVPLSSIRYSPEFDCWILEPYDGEDLKTALVDCPPD